MTRTKRQRSYMASMKAEAAVIERSGRRSGRASMPRTISSTVNTIIERYAEICKRSQPQLSEAEWKLIFDVCNGWLSWDTPMSPAYLWMEVADGVKLNGLDEKWEVDGEDLVSRLKAMTYPELVAVVDRAELYWASPEDDG